MRDELARLKLAIDRHYSHRPAAGIKSPFFLGSFDYACYEAWSGELEVLRRELIDLCEGHIEAVCNHPVGAIVQSPFTGLYRCDLCGKDLKYER